MQFSIILGLNLNQKIVDLDHYNLILFFCITGFSNRINAAAAHDLYWTFFCV